jgi:hypothetical protein
VGVAASAGAAARAAQERSSWPRLPCSPAPPPTPPPAARLLQVVDVDHAAGRATVWLVPRVDYALLAESADPEVRKRNPFKRSAVRPQARAFSLAEARKYDLDVKEERGGLLVLGSSR